MSEVNILYRNTSIATMDNAGTKTLKTQNKLCDSDIQVQYTRPVGTLDYTVIFNDRLNQPIQITNIAANEPISRPSLTVDGTRITSQNWEDSNGNDIGFPYTPTSNITLKNSARMAYIINPTGTTITSIITHPDGTPSTITYGSGDRGASTRLDYYIAEPSVTKEYIDFNTNTVNWKIAGRYNTDGWNVYMRSDLIDCSQYNHILVRYLPFYEGGYGAWTLHLASTTSTSGYVPTSEYAQLNMGNSAYTTAYYQNLYGSSWNYTSAMSDNNYNGWQDWTYDLTNINNFYLWLRFCDGSGAIAYAYLY